MIAAWALTLLFCAYLVYREFFQLLIIFLVIVYLVKNRSKLKKWTGSLLEFLGKIILCFLILSVIGFVTYAVMETINRSGLALTTGLFVQEIVSLNLTAVISGLATFAVTGVAVIAFLLVVGYGISAVVK
jgi:TctA family transporter